MSAASARPEEHGQIVLAGVAACTPVGEEQSSRIHALRMNVHVFMALRQTCAGMAPSSVSRAPCDLPYLSKRDGDFSSSGVDYVV